MKNLSGLLAVLAIFLCTSISYGQTETLIKAINCGGAQVTGVDGIVYEADVSNSDVSFSTQSAALTHLGYLVSPPLDAPYTTSRYISRNVGTEFNYTISNLSNVHQYRLVLHFVEPYHGVASGTDWGTRVFDVDINNGEHMINDYNIMTAAASAIQSTNPVDGAQKVAKIERIVNITGTELVIQFNNIPSKNDAVVHAIELYEQDDTDTEDPDAPGELPTTLITTNSAQLNWSTPNDNVGVTYYNVFQGTTKLTNDDITGNSYSLSGLTPNSPYTYTVRAYDAENNESDPRTLSFNTLDDNNGPGYNPDFVLRLNAGSTSDATFNGKTFVSDGGYFSLGSPSSNNQLGLSQPYSSERFGGGGTMAYDIPVVSGQYQVILSFTELHWGAPSGGNPSGGQGDRVFDVSVEDILELNNLDVFSAAGGAGIILRDTITVNVNDDELNIDFSSADGAGHPQITAIEILGSNFIDPGTPIPPTGDGQWSKNDNESNIFFTSGNVGIGTQNPTATSGTNYLLAVNGSVRAKEVKVETGWADYVFFDDYNLPTLQEVEKHIEEKGHLINIPSAEEVEANGIKLGEMNKLLLEKVEELTLYIIQQEKRIKALEAKK